LTKIIFVKALIRYFNFIVFSNKYIFTIIFNIFYKAFNYTIKLFSLFDFFLVYSFIIIIYINVFSKEKNNISAFFNLFHITIMKLRKGTIAFIHTIWSKIRPVTSGIIYLLLFVIQNF
jgi:hypothetical protein